MNFKCLLYQSFHSKKAAVAAVTAAAMDIYSLRNLKGKLLQQNIFLFIIRLLEHELLKLNIYKWWHCRIRKRETAHYSFNGDMMVDKCPAIYDPFCVRACVCVRVILRETNIIICQRNVLTQKKGKPFLLRPQSSKKVIFMMWRSWRHEKKTL